MFKGQNKTNSKYKRLAEFRKEKYKNKDKNKNKGLKISKGAGEYFDINLGGGYVSAD